MKVLAALKEFRQIAVPPLKVRFPVELPLYELQVSVLPFRSKVPAECKTFLALIVSASFSFTAPAPLIPKVNENATPLEDMVFVPEEGVMFQLMSWLVNVMVGEKTKFP